MIWSTDKANEWYKGKGWILGFNYLPSTAVNSTEMWQAESFDVSTIEKELRLASECGYNSCRVFLQYLVWKHEGAAFLKNFERFLEIAGKNAITVLPIFFDDCAFSGKEPRMGKQDEPIPGIHNSGWTASPGFTIADDPASEPSLKSYVQTLVSKYKNDSRIIAWDLYNEPGNSNREDKCLPLLKKTFEWARECDPSQPLSAGVYLWKDFDLSVIELSDIISFHDYNNIEITKDRIKMLKQYNRPLLCTEWLHRPNGSAIESHMPLYKSENIGIYNWGLVNGKTQTHLNWDKEKNKNGGPSEWQHDIFTKDLKPYSAGEVAFIKKISGKFD
jgi:endo-1,4-beta-mannosidase